MTAVALIPGAGGLGWYWHLVERDLRARGFDAFAVDLAAGGRTGLPAYADAVVEAIGGRTEFDLATYFLHDLPGELATELGTRAASQLDERFDDVCAFGGWPPVPIHVIAGRDDRFFPLELQQRVAHERVGVEPVVVPGGHLAALSHPAELAEAIAGLLPD